jgi:uncharacterized protein YegL
MCQCTVVAGTGCQHQSDIVFLLDRSGSITQGNFNKVLMFVDHLVRLIGVSSEQARVGLVTFSDDARIAFHLKQHTTPSALTKAIMAVPYLPGQTNMAAALKTARDHMFQHENGDRPGKRVTLGDP